MEQELFDVLSDLEMQMEREKLRDLPPNQRLEALAPDAAKFISLLAISQKAKSIVEVGAGIGYSTLWLAYAASLTGGQVLSCELDPAKAEQAKINLDKAGLSGVVDILVGDARQTLRQREEPVDFLFIDADFGQYETYFDVVYKRMGVGSTIVADDIIAHENELADYTTYVQNHPHLESVTVPLGTGIEFTVKTAE